MSGRSSVVERQLPKLNVVGSIPIARSTLPAFSQCLILKGMEQQTRPLSLADVGVVARIGWDHVMSNQDEKLAAKVKGWMYIAEGVVTVAGGLFLLWISMIAPLLPIAFSLFIFVALLVPAAWFIRMDKRSLDRANEL